MAGQPTDQDKEFMREAIKVMRTAGVVEKTGGPFGCVVSCDERMMLYLLR
jgi:tRNA(Arg) A34 adenosine deaminase TadA